MRCSGKDNVRYFIVLALLFCSPAMAYEVGDKATWDGTAWVVDQPERRGLDFLASYDYYLEPHHHNYDDAQGFTLGLEHPLVGNFKGQAVYKHIVDIDFPAVQDPKGSWGEMRGHIGMYNLKYELPYGKQFGFYLLGGVGYGFWDFRQNPALQDAGVTIELDPSVVVQLGLGASMSLGNGWKGSAYSGWFDTNVEKHISENQAGIGNILDSGRIGIQYVPISLEVKKEF